jgi:uncharacterized protein
MVEATKLQEVAAELDRRFGLEVLYLYGSQATGRDRAGSDVDLGALFRRSPSPAELFDAGGVLATLLGRDVDLVDLDRVSPILVRQVLKHGRVIHEAAPARRIALITKNIALYEDLKLLRREGEERLLRRFRDG